VGARARLSLYRVSPISEPSCDDAVVGAVTVRALDGNRRLGGAFLLLGAGDDRQNGAEGIHA